MESSPLEVRNFALPTSVSQHVRRFRLTGGETDPAFRRALSIVKGVLPKSRAD
jgi:hypothetical protein